MPPSKEMTPDAALATLRRAEQVFGFLGDLHQAAQLIVQLRNDEVSMQKAFDEAQAAYTTMQASIRDAESQYENTVTMLAERKERMTQECSAEIDALMARLVEKRADVEAACKNLDADYLAKHAEHTKRIDELIAAIHEKEGYLAQLNARIGAIRADFDTMRV